MVVHSCLSSQHWQVEAELRVGGDLLLHREFEAGPRLLQKKGGTEMEEVTLTWEESHNVNEKGGRIVRTEKEPQRRRVG